MNTQKRLWQDLVSDYGFQGGYQSVQRFAYKLLGAQVPQARAVILTAPGKEGQVDYGSGPMVGEAQAVSTEAARRTFSPPVSLLVVPTSRTGTRRGSVPYAPLYVEAAVYDLPFFKNGNWFMKNVVGNWRFSPIYTYESPEWATVQSAKDANLNGDSAGDRTPQLERCKGDR